MRAEAFREHWPDAADLLQRLERPEWSTRRPILDDPRRQRRSDPWQTIQFLRGGDIDVHRTGQDRSCRALFDRIAHAWSRPSARVRGLRLPAGTGRRGAAACSTGGDGRVHLGDLNRQRGLGIAVAMHRAQGAAAAHPDSERGDRRDEEQRLAFARGRHDSTVRRAPAITEPADCSSNEKRAGCCADRRSPVLASLRV
jgi:hypothetical protein